MEMEIWNWTFSEGHNNNKNEHLEPYSFFKMAMMDRDLTFLVSEDFFLHFTANVLFSYNVTNLHFTIVVAFSKL